jgi:hypothetical protein
MSSYCERISVIDYEREAHEYTMQQLHESNLSHQHLAYLNRVIHKYEQQEHHHQQQNQKLIHNNHHQQQQQQQHLSIIQHHYRVHFSELIVSFILDSVFHMIQYSLFVIDVYKAVTFSIVIVIVCMCMRGTIGQQIMNLRSVRNDRPLGSFAIMIQIIVQMLVFWIDLMRLILYCWKCNRKRDVEPLYFLIDDIFGTETIHKHSIYKFVSIPYSVTG